MELREIRGYASSTRRCMLSGGLPGLTLRELLQVSVGNTLLLRGLWLSVAVALHGAAAVLEHPAVPFELHKPSIWRAALVLLWLRRPNALFFQKTIQQWRYGSPGVKAHHIFVCQCVDERLIGAMCVDWHWEAQHTIDRQIWWRYFSYLRCQGISCRAESSAGHGLFVGVQHSSPPKACLPWAYSGGGPWSRIGTAICLPGWRQLPARFPTGARFASWCEALHAQHGINLRGWKNITYLYNYNMAQ